MFPIIAIVAFTFAAMNMSFQSGQENPDANNLFQAHSHSEASAPRVYGVDAVN